MEFPDLPQDPYATIPVLDRQVANPYLSIPAYNIQHFVNFAK
jgi:hypothetical protein